jgi:hypothetical protein
MYIGDAPMYLKLKARPTNILFLSLIFQTLVHVLFIKIEFDK